MTQVRIIGADSLEELEREVNAFLRGRRSRRVQVVQLVSNGDYPAREFDGDFPYVVLVAFETREPAGEEAD